MGTTRDNARDSFFRAIRDEAPEVLAALARDVLPLFRPQWEARQPAGPYTVNFVRLSQPHRYKGSYSPLDWAIVRWAKRWRLNHRWCYERVLWTLHFWCEQGTTEPPDWAYGSFSDTVIGRLEFTADPWQPNKDTWHAYKARTMKAFARHLTGHRTRLLADREKVGAYAIKEVPIYHYAWLVRFHVLGERYAQIAKGHGRTGVHEKTVREAVTRLARFLELPLRPAKQGRPKKLGEIQDAETTPV